MEQPVEWKFELLAAGDHAWVIARSVGILAMQGGFALLEAGCVRPANRANIMMKNVADMSFGMIGWLLLGWTLSFSNQGSAFVGGLDQAGFNTDPNYTMFFFHFSFAATTGTIVSGAVAGRMRFLSYMVLSSVCITNLVYPIVVHWVWSSDGWLYKMDFVDFAGVGVVHLTGGSAALLATISLGPRTGRYPTPNRLLFRLGQRRDEVLLGLTQRHPALATLLGQTVVEHAASAPAEPAEDSSARRLRRTKTSLRKMGQAAKQRSGSAGNQ